MEQLEEFVLAEGTSSQEIYSNLQQLPAQSALTDPAWLHCYVSDRQEQPEQRLRWACLGQAGHSVAVRTTVIAQSHHRGCFTRFYEMQRRIVRVAECLTSAGE